MNQIQIIGALMLATGKRVEDVAKENGYSKFAFYRTINGTTKAQRPRELIASIIGMSVNEIWPEPAKRKEN
jgi:lambda repressor-like predicted transcriptional regulator